ncbi:unnamed protein product [Prorocentrum cordatum]|uniref:RNA-directed RNA polymerase n=1 Tax=Prorocentrum cordatum TaxID=2364126 RepID=A0ABN9TGQ7_9DINO|nr:unnamed protein product [Polarella glacialis]
MEAIRQRRALDTWPVLSDRRPSTAMGLQGGRCQNRGEPSREFEPFCREQFMAAWVHAAGGWVLGALSERWTGPGRSGIAEVSCRCVFEGSDTTDGLVAILREQLARCGPEHLQGVACQPCPPCPLPPGHYTGLDLCGAAVVGVALGAGLATAGWLAAGSPGRPAARARALAVEDDAGGTHVATPAGLGYEDDENFQWHHRVLLVKGDAQKWIWLTPDGEVAFVDLATFRVLALRRSGPFPARHAGNIYAFDEVAPEDMQGYLEEARALGTILGFDLAGVVGLPGDKWYVSDPTSSHFGEEVPPQVLANEEVLVRRGDVGLVRLDDVWVHAIKVGEGQNFDTHLARARGGAGRDPRIVGDDRDQDGGRYIDFRDSVRRMKEATIPGWPLQGRRATREAVLSLRDGGQGNWEEHHTTWLRRSGVAERGNVAREHHMICVSLRMMQQFDQLDLFNIAGAEYLVRRLKQLESATRKNPRAPDFEGLDLILDTGVDDTGGMVLPEFDGWVGDQARARAQTMKANRQWQEESVAHVNTVFVRQYIRSTVSPPARCAIGAAGQVALPIQGLRELLKSDSLYGGAPSKVVPYEESKLKFWQSSVTPRDVEEVCPKIVVDAFRDPDAYIRKPDRVVEQDLELLPPIKPYWDARLASDASLRRDFLLRLAGRGLVGFRRRIRSRVGCFFVEKKGGWIRLVVDARDTNRTHWAPPHAALGTPAALSEQDWSDAALSDAGWVSADGSPAQIFGSSLDLQDSFYQFFSERVAEDFGMDFPERASYYQVSHIWTPDGLSPVDPDELVFPVFRGVPIGWSWALWAVHSSVTSWVSDTLPGGARRLLLDKQPAPVAAPFRPTGSVYVDNVSFLGLSSDDVGQALQAAKDKLDSLGIARHEVEGPATHFSTVGVEYDGRRRRLRHSDHRAWRLYLACQELERPGVPRAAWQIRVFLGHCVQHCLLLRPALSIFRLLYRFVDAQGQGPPVALSAGARREIQLFRGLIFQAVVFLDRPMSSLVLCSDSSEAGYALHRRRADVRLLRQLAATRERWRFVPDEKRPDAALDDTFSPGWVPGAGGVLGEPPGATGMAVWAPPPTRSREGARGVLKGRLRPTVRPAGVSVPDSLVDPRDWSLIVEGAWRRGAPIHLLEGRIALGGLRRAARQVDCHGSRVLSLGDNMSELLSIEKGRAVDLGLACLCRRAAAYQIACGISWRRRHLDTDRNLSGAGSRKALQGVYRQGQRRVGGRSDRPTLPAGCPPPAPTTPAPPAPSATASWPVAEEACEPPPAARLRGGRLQTCPPRPPPRASGAAGRCGPRRSPRSREGPAAGAPGHPARKATFDEAEGARDLSPPLGLAVAAPIDIKFGGWGDLLRPSIETVVRQWIVSRKVWFVHFGTPCTPWWSLENPRGSWLFSWEPLQKFLSEHSKVSVVYDCCQFGAPYQKPTRIESDLPELGILERRCLGGHAHEHLQGKVKVRDRQGRLKQFWRTTLAGAYPPGVCHSAARALARAAPAAAWRPDGDPLLPGHWEAQLRRAAKMVDVQPSLECPSCPRKWVALWPPDAVPADSSPGFLRRSQVRPATQARYLASVAVFATAMGVVADRWVSNDLPLVDTLLEEYFEQLYVDGGSKSTARYTLAALAYRFSVSLRAPGVFPKAKGALAGWGKLEPDVTSEPLCWAAACLMALYLAGLNTEIALQAARGLVVQFDTYLRPGELLDLRVPCCILPQPSAGSGYNKMGLVVGASALVMGDDDDTVLIDGQSRAGVAGALMALVKSANQARQGRLMFLHSYASYNRLLKRAAVAVGLPTKVTAHLPRHGGPSEDYLRGARSLADIQSRGRWSSFRSVQRYQKSGRALASFRRLSAAVKAEAKRAEALQLSFLS